MKRDIELTLTKAKKVTMRLMYNRPVLAMPITKLDVSREFKAMAKANGYRTLGSILEDGIGNLPSRRKSGYRMLKEMLDILDENGLIALAD